jgi:hypothetical protein
MVTSFRDLNTDLPSTLASFSTGRYVDVSYLRECPGSEMYEQGLELQLWKISG